MSVRPGFALLVPVLAALLAACGTTPERAPMAAAPATPASAAAPASPATTGQAATIEPKPAPADVWQRLRAGFALPDCITPAVRRAQLETRYPIGFAQQLQRALPVIDYVQRQVQARGIAGEFALLPWVESHFREIPPSRKRAAGMWQIMPITAKAQDMAVGPGYDARLDKTVATRVALDMLAGYHRQWRDWRLADMAYNTGASRMRRILRRHGTPPAEPVLPDLPVSRTTRHHLTRLLAIACIVRDPARFHVRLPRLAKGDRLQVFKLPLPADLRQVASLAGLPWKTLHQLNAGYRGPITPMNSPRTLLLPARVLPALKQAIAAGKLHDQSRLARQHGGDGPLGLPVRHTVRRGDSLWRIARHYGLTVSQLRRWNHLSRRAVLHPGQKLWLAKPD